MRGTYYIRSAHTGREVGQVYDARSDRDALTQYLHAQGYSDDPSYYYVHERRWLTVVGNDEVYATTTREENH